MEYKQDGVTYRYFNAKGILPELLSLKYAMSNYICNKSVVSAYNMAEEYYEEYTSGPYCRAYYAQTYKRNNLDVTIEPSKFMYKRGDADKWRLQLFKFNEINGSILRTIAKIS